MTLKTTKLAFRRYVKVVSCCGAASRVGRGGWDVEVHPRGCGDGVGVGWDSRDVSMRERVGNFVLQETFVV